MPTLNVQNTLVHRLAAISIVLLVVAACYHSTLGFSPIWDDSYAADTAGYYLRDDIWHIAFAEKYLSPNYYRPLPVWTRAYESFHAGIEAVGYVGHAINLSLHLCATALVMLLAQSTPPSSTKKNWLIAPLAGLFFGLHPAALPIPAWISARFDLMLVLFVLLALCADIFVRNIRWRCMGIASAFLGAALSKETAIVFPLVLPLWHLLLVESGVRQNDWHPWRNHTYRNIYVSVFAAGLLYLLIRYLGLGYLVPIESIKDAGLGNKNITQHAWLILETLGLYFRLVWLPFGALQPSFVQGTEFSLLNMHATLGITVLLTTACTLQFQKTRLLGLTLALMMISLSPVLNFIPTPIKDSFADLRFVYITIALCSVTLIPLLIHNAISHKQTIFIIIIVLSGWLTLSFWNIQRALPAWKDDVHFWTWYIETHPDTLLGRENLLAAYLNTDQYLQAMPILDEYANLAQSSSKSHSLRGSFLLKSGKYAEAEAAFIAAIPMVEQISEWSLLMINIADAQVHQSKMADIAALIEQILIVEPGNGDANMIKLRYGLLQKDAAIVREAYTQLQSNYAQKPAALDKVINDAGIRHADIKLYLSQAETEKTH